MTGARGVEKRQHMITKFPAPWRIVELSNRGAIISKTSVTASNSVFAITSFAVANGSMTSAPRVATDQFDLRVPH
jgi:hypothetical protein